MGTATNRKFAVITGASSGIGFELAKQCVQNGFDVLVCAEDAAITAAAAQLSSEGAYVEPLQADLATREGCQQLAAAVTATARPIDALILNAGVGLGDEFLKQDLERVFNMIALNCNHVVHLAHLLVPSMVARGEGRVMITASVVSTAPNPYQAIYAATKAFDMSFAEALAYELKDSGVTVTALQPGATETNFFERAELMDTKLADRDKDDPALVAKNGFEAMLAGKTSVLAGGFKSKVEGLMNEVMPESFKASQTAAQTKPGSGSGKA